MAYPIFHSQYTAAQIEGTIGKSPRINPVTLTWEVWDIASGAYIDTGVAADAQDAADRAEAAAVAAAASEKDAEDAATAAEGAATRAETAASTLVVESTLSTSSTNPVQNKVITEALNDKLNVDGYSALATVGNAEQLVSTVRVTDDAPYLFRTAGGAADIGNREYDKIVGGTVAHNQLVTNGNFSEGDDGTYGWTTSGGTLSVSGGVATYTITNVAATNNYIRATDSSPNARPTWYHGHKYLFAFTHRELNSDGTDVSSTGYVRFSFLAGTEGWGDYTSYDWRRSYAVSSHSNTGGAATQRDWYAIRLIGTGAGPKAAGDKIEVKDVMIIDLTAMFGIEIADYIATLETAEAGSGIAWLKQYGFLAKSYYPRNVGALASVEATAHEMVGFNAWDEEWERGTINNDGTTGSSTVTIRSKNFTPCISGKDYCFTKPANVNFQIFWYDANQTFIKRNYFEVSAYAVYTVPDNAAYFKITFGNSSNPITAYANNICVNISWSGYRDGEYAPHVKHTYPLDSSLTLRGVPMLDMDGGLCYDGDTYAADGTVERKYGTVDLGSLTWTQGGEGHENTYWAVMGAYVKPADNDTVARIVCAEYPATSYNDILANPTTPGIALVNGEDYFININDPTVADAAALTAALSGVMLVYPLAEPTTEEAVPYQSPQIVEDFGTERYVVTAQDGFSMPVGHVTAYPANLRDKLQHLPELAETDGTYAIQQSGTQMSLVPLLLPTGLPDAPSEDGNYRLRCTVANGEATYSWEAEI